MATAKSTCKLVFEAAINREDMRDGERQAEAWGVTRRIATAVLTRSSKELIDGFGHTDDGLAAVLDAASDIGDYLEWRQAETELLTAAHARLLAVYAELLPANVAPFPRQR